MVVSNVESEFLQEALKDNVRLDSRGMCEIRKISLHYLRDLGHVDVILGSTRCTATVSAEITPPREEAPNEGVLIFNTEFSPMCAPGVEPGRISEEEVFVSRMLDKCIRRSRAIDTEGLCIIAKQKVWTVRVDVRVLDHNGNIVDCASVAAAAALQHFRRPDVKVLGEQVSVYSSMEKDYVPLKLNRIPLCTSFAFFKDSFVLDPSLMEETLRQGQLTVATNIDKEICAMVSGGSPITLDQILQCTRLACSKSLEMTRIIETALRADTEKRKSLFVV